MVNMVKSHSFMKCRMLHCNQFKIILKSSLDGVARVLSFLMMKATITKYRSLEQSGALYDLFDYILLFSGGSSTNHR